MLSTLRLQIEELVTASVREVLQDSSISIDPVELEKTKEKVHGDFSSNIALRLAKQLKKNPISLADSLCALLDQKIKASALRSLVEKVEVKKPGFINFYITREAFFPVLAEIFKQGARYGSSQRGIGKKVQIEFVSANPTGPLTVAHARQAAVGDALGNILKFLGFDVTKEYYINDEGNQIKILGQSVKARAQEILGGTDAFPEDHYQGAYVVDMAKEFMAEQKVLSLDALNALSDKTFQAFGVHYLMDLIRKDLNDFGVHFDVWTSQSKVASPASTASTLKIIEQKGYIYNQDGATWFKSTELG
ncbi:MAG: arginine--tRNA ligase, partial [Candidatus Omnitrophota bacterium]